MTLLANAERLAWTAVAAALRPSPPIDYLKWAETNVVFGDSEPLPGPYDRKAFVYFDEVLGALAPGDPCRYVTLQASAQIGKTILGNIFVLGSVTMGKGTAFVVHPTIENAARWSRMKLGPMMKSIEPVREAFPSRARDSADAILFKERRDGMANILISGANSAASLSMLSANFQLQDDLSKWQPNEAGDAEVQADSRSRAHEFAKIFKTSTPLLLPGCKISKDFAAGSMEMPYVPCPHCSEMMVLEWENMLRNLDAEHPERACFSCDACGAIIEEKHRARMLEGFEWRPTNPSAKREHRSFWIWSAYSPLQSWSRIAAEWLRSRGDPSSEQSFITDVVGLPYQVKGEGKPPEVLYERAQKSHYERGTVPEGALVLTLGVDVQLDRVEWQLLGHGEHFRRYVIDVGTIGKHIAEPDCQRNLDLLIDRTWPNSRGKHIPVSMTAIDANYSTDDVLDFARRYSPSRLICIRGIPGDAAPRLARVQRERSEKKGTILKRSRRFFNIGVYAFKLALYRDLEKNDPNERGYIAFPRGLPLSYFEELVAEVRRPVKRMGMITWIWERISASRANEAHDTFLYASSAAIKYGTNWISDIGWAKLRAELEPGAPLVPPAPPPSTRLPMRRGVTASIASQLAR